MCRECELIDYPTAGWPWLPCAPVPRVPRSDTDMELASVLTDLADAMREISESMAYRKSQSAVQSAIAPSKSDRPPSRERGGL